MIIKNKMAKHNKINIDNLLYNILLYGHLPTN